MKRFSPKAPLTPLKASPMDLGDQSSPTLSDDSGAFSTSLSAVHLGTHSPAYLFTISGGTKAMEVSEEEEQEELITQELFNISEAGCQKLLNMIINPEMAEKNSLLISAPVSVQLIEREQLIVSRRAELKMKQSQREQHGFLRTKRHSDLEEMMDNESDENAKKTNRAL